MTEFWIAWSYLKRQETSRKTPYRRVLCLCPFLTVWHRNEMDRAPVPTWRSNVWAYSLQEQSLDLSEEWEVKLANQPGLFTSYTPFIGQRNNSLVEAVIDRFYPILISMLANLPKDFKDERLKWIIKASFRLLWGFITSMAIIFYYDR